jgi:AcrR family transcriptional regulator
MSTGPAIRARAGDGMRKQHMAQPGKQGRKRTAAPMPRKRNAHGDPGFVLGPRAETKQRLLAATINHLEDNGVADLSLRQLAERLGTSHRLLIYHFGTREGLLVAVVEEIERIQRAWLESLWERDMSPIELMRMSWERTCDPKLDRQLRLFVEIYGHVVQGRAHTAPLLGTLIGAWMEPVTDVFKRIGMTTAQARVHARLHVATMRGLMLDLLTTGDLKAGQAAFDQYIGQYEKLPGAHKSERRPKR